MILTWYLLTMKLITRDTDYAIRALVYMAGFKGGRISVPELVSGTRIPKPFLRKIMQLLGKKGFVRSYKGIGGGFALKKTPERMALTDLIEAIQGRISLNECFFKKIACPRKKECLLKKKIDSLEAYIIKELKALTLKDIACK